jgi:hypothetical protein
LIEKTLQDVPVVCDYLDIFSDELPGMPPNQDIEFMIDLVPRIGLIAKHPYRMVADELAELKKQLQVRVGKILDTQFPNLNYPNPDPKYPITILDSDCKNPKLVWVIRVMFPGTRTTQITRNISNICSSIPNTKT